jgi:hypothetical protein
MSKSPPPRSPRKGEALLADRLLEVLGELNKRIPHGLTLQPESRQWARLLIGPIQHLRALMGAEEAAPFFVRHAVLPAALSPHVSPAQRRTFLREMRAVPFSEQGQPLGAYPDAAALMSPDTYLFTPQDSTPCPWSPSND